MTGIILPTAVVVDIDGTVATPQHRQWHEYHLVHGDTPIEPTATLVRTLADAHQIVFLTGRTEDSRAVTVSWLETHFSFPWRLLMRPDGDDTPHSEYKRAMLHSSVFPHFLVVLAIEDNPNAVEMYRSEGLLVIDAQSVHERPDILVPDWQTGAPRAL